MRARLAQYASARNSIVTPGDGWWLLDDESEWEALLFSRWPVLTDDFVRRPPTVCLCIPAGQKGAAQALHPNGLTGGITPVVLVIPTFGIAEVS
jgi:hypothetical protein